MPVGAIWDPSFANDPGTRPGVYINFESDTPSEGPLVADGVIHVIAVADWGPVRSQVKIKNPADVDKFLGTAIADIRTGVKEALRMGAREVSFYRIATVAGTLAASLVLNDATVPALTVTAKYPGTFGNTLKAEVVANAIDGTKKDLRIYSGTKLVEVFTGTDNDDIVATYTLLGSNYVIVALNGTANRVPVNIAATSLAGGNSGTAVVAQDYTDALAAATGYTFRVLAMDTIDTAIVLSTKSWVATQRDGGQRVTYVAPANPASAVSTLAAQAATLNHEGTILLATGYKIPASYTGDFTPGAVDKTLNPVTAATALAALIAVYDTRSITKALIAGATDTTVRYSAADYRAGLTGGLLMLSLNGSRVQTERGINTLQLAAQVAPKSADWRKIRFIAIQDEFVDRVLTFIDANFVGKVENDVRGRSEAVRQVQDRVDSMVRDRLFNPGDDTVVPIIPPPVAYLDPRFAQTGDNVYVAVSARAIDAAEDFFFSVRM